MAVIKAVSSKAPIGTVIDYVSQEEKTEDKLLGGLNISSADTAMYEMQATKEVWGKTDGRTYKHFVQSFAPDEDVTAEQAHELAMKFAEQCPLFDGFEVLVATHKDREHIHTHFVVNSVSFEDGHKFQMKSTELQDMKDLSDKLCAEYGLTITQKGKTFHGEDSKETTAYSKEQYQLLKKAEQGEVNSYVQDIALAVCDCREKAISRDDFKNLMEEKGYSVKWEDSRKYITFTDIKRQNKKEKSCSIRNNKLEKYYHMDFSKEGLEREFESNARATADRAEAQSRTDSLLKRTSIAISTGVTTSQKSEPAISDKHKGCGNTSTKGTSEETFIRNARAKIASATAREKISGAERANREAEQQRLRIERSQRVEEERREAETRKRKRSYPSR